MPRIGLLSVFVPRSERNRKRSSQSYPMSSIYRNQSGDGSWSEFFGDIYSGTLVGIGHFLYVVWEAIPFSSTPSLGIDTEYSSSSAQGLRVVGVGYGRTGTYSLAMALDELGFPTLVSISLLLFNCLPIIF